MNILFTICGRAGSKGVKNKNIRDFLGHPLPYYTLSTIDLFLKKNAYQFKNADIALSTDSPELIDLFKKVKRDIFIVNRDKNLAGDFVGKIDVIRNCAQLAEEYYGVIYDIVVDLDITSPLRTVDDLKNTIQKKAEDGENVDVVYTVTEARRNPYFNMVMKQGDNYDCIIPSNYVSRQQTPLVYDMNASIYAYDKNYIHGNTASKKADIVTMMDTGILDIDGELDYELMQVIAKYLYENKEEFAEIRNNIDAELK